jgi:hypothetical protein
MSAANTVQDRNRELADKINAEARSNPQTPYANKFAGIANGQVVVVADDLRSIVRRLRQIEPDAGKTMCLEASRDYDEITTKRTIFARPPGFDGIASLPT